MRWHSSSLDVTVLTESFSLSLLVGLSQGSTSFCEILLLKKF
jgi:hypothetical protein